MSFNAVTNLNGGTASTNDLTGATSSATVRALQHNPVDSTLLGSTEDGYVATWVNGSDHIAFLPPASGDGITQLTGDVLAGPGAGSEVATVVAISGSSPILITPGSLEWTAATTGPTLTQASRSSASAETLSIVAQGATGATHTGGDLLLASGTSGSSTAGEVAIQVGSVPVVTMTPTQVQWSSSMGVQTANVKATQTANYQVLVTDFIIPLNSTGGVFNVTLPASPSVGDTYWLKDVGGAAFTNNITVLPNSGNTIDGASSYLLQNNREAITVICTANTVWSIF